MTPEKRERMLQFCLNKSLPYERGEKNLAYKARQQFEAINGILYEKALEPNGAPRRVVVAHEVLNIVARAHCEKLHANADSVWAYINGAHKGITRDEVRWLDAHCIRCLERQAVNEAHPLQPIDIERTFERVQVDLIDMQDKPDDGYRWILHAKDHFSKLSGLYPLFRKEAVQVAHAFMHWIMAYGPPRIVQCDNGTEFKGRSSSYLHYLDCQIIVTGANSNFYCTPRCITPTSSRARYQNNLQPALPSAVSRLG
jgi:hypothetical protein